MKRQGRFEANRLPETTRSHQTSNAGATDTSCDYRVKAYRYYSRGVFWFVISAVLSMVTWAKAPFPLESNTLVGWIIGICMLLICLGLRDFFTTDRIGYENQRW